MKLDIDEIKKHWKLATEGLASWRTETRESYDFVASHQWNEDDIARLEAEERPAVTFDRVGVFIDAICGMEINNRQAIKYFPVEQGDVHVNDVLTQTVKYFENDCGAEDEDSEAVRDAVICGIGVTETVMDHEKHPDGAPNVIRRDPLSTWYDPTASRRNLEDARFVFYGDWVHREEADRRWPKGNFSGEPPYTGQMQPHRADRAFEYREDVMLEDQHEDEVFILQYQCWKREDYYRMQDPTTGKVVSLSSSQFSAAKKLFEEITGAPPRDKIDYVKQTRKVYYKAFVSGETILEEGVLSLPSFTFQFLTFKRDRNKRMWFGVVRVMKDPQRWANKWLSQILHIVNTNAKGGAFAEENAFKDPRKAEDQWGMPNPLIMLKEGAIDKIRERNQTQYPTGLDRLMMFAFNALPSVTGINLEVLGLADREQAGVLEQQRRQSAFGILAPLFAAIREYRKGRGRLMLAFIRNFIPEGTLVRIVGQAGEQWIPLIKDELEYDVKVDQAPDSPDYKKQVWEALGQILPAMMKAGYPVPPEVLLHSPLPTDISEQWVAWIKQQGWMPPEHRQQMEQMQQTLQQLGEESQKLKEENMMMRLDHTVETGKLQLKAQDAAERTQLKVYQTQMESLNRRIEAAIQDQKNAIQAALEAQKLEVNTHLQVRDQDQKDREHTIKAMDVMLKQLNDLQSAVQKKKPSKAKVQRIQDGVYQIEF